MRATTNVWIGIRNVGDANHAGEFFVGTLRESLAWLIGQLGGMSMAKRIDVSLGRNQDEVRLGLGLNKSRHLIGNAHDILDSLLKEVMPDDGLEDSSIPHSAGQIQVPGDDWKGD